MRMNTNLIREDNTVNVFVRQRSHTLFHIYFPMQKNKDFY